MATQPTSNFDFQNFYSTTLTADITSGALTIALASVPTPTEGILVIDPDSATNREVVFYTGKTVSTVTLPSDGRGWDSTSAVSHLNGTTVIMAPVAYMLRMLKNGSLFDASISGWTTLGSTFGTVTYNGNRSYTATIAGVDKTSILSNGMRLKMTRTVAANTYMGGLLNGTTQYFTKATPTGTLSTVTDNFTVMGFAQPTSYADGDIACRADAATNNALELRMDSSGRIICTVFNGGVANFRSIVSYQSIPLNKKTHVAATWAAGVVTMYLDGVSIPVQTAVTGGTAPTTAGTGGDFSIGRRGAGASFFFPGYISNVGVFNAVLAAGTIRDYATRILTGSETNCIGAWSLNNTLNDQNAAGNNLSAGGSASFTSGLSPFATPASGTSDGLTEFGIVTSASFSTNTTLTVQVPEGSAIPTSGGVSAVSYSTQKVPYGFPAQRGKWLVLTVLGARAATAGGIAANSINNPGGINISVPIGEWRLGFEVNVIDVSSVAVAFLGVAAGLSTSASSISDYELIGDGPTLQVAVTQANAMITRTKDISLAATTPYYFIVKPITAGATHTLFTGSDPSLVNTIETIRAECAYL